jgi:peroxiredoxin
MSLNTQIQALIKNFRENLPPELAALVEQGAGEISGLAIVENALNVGDKAPDFTLKDYKGEEHSMQDYLRQGPLVLTFYRGLWCPYCNLQLAAYNARLTDIKAAGGTLVAVSPESAKGYEVVQNSEMPQEAKETVIAAPDFDVLYDAGAALAKQYGLTFTLPEAHKKLLDMMKVDIEKANGDDTYTFADPATYIIDTDGIIKWAFVPNNYRKRAEPDAIIEQLKKLAYNPVMEERV